MSSNTANQSIIRKALLTAALEGDPAVSTVEIKHIDLAPGQRAGRHMHPCPVVGYIAKGAVDFQIEGGPVETLRAGAAFYEPAGVTISRFDNASESEPLTFIAFYLLGAGEDELIRMLPQSGG